MSELGEILITIVSVFYIYLVYCIAKEKASEYYDRVVQLESSLDKNGDNIDVSECFQTLIKIDKIKKKFLYKIFYVYL